MKYILALLSSTRIVNAQVVHFANETIGEWLNPLRKFHLNLWNQSDVTVSTLEPVHLFTRMTPDAPHLSNVEVDNPFEFTVQCTQSTDICNSVKATLDR